MEVALLPLATACGLRREINARMPTPAREHRYLRLLDGLSYCGPIFPQLFAGGTRTEKFASALE